MTDYSALDWRGSSSHVHTPDRYGRLCTCRRGPTLHPRFGWLHYDLNCLVMQDPNDEQRRLAGECIHWPGGRWPAPCTRKATGPDGLCGICRFALSRRKQRTA